MGISPLACVHRGEATGEILACQGCNRVYELAVFHCLVHTRCTLTKLARNPTIHCCRICPDRKSV